MHINTFTPKEFKDHISKNKIYTGFLTLPAGNLKIQYTDLGIFGAEFATELKLSENIAVYPRQLLLVGSEFQIAVWQETLKIKSGTIQSYQDIAKFLNKPNHSRAVARALATNKIAYFIPCHRVVAKSGKPSGYKWGVDKKLELLKAEKSA